MCLCDVSVTFCDGVWFAFVAGVCFCVFVYSFVGFDCGVLCDGVWWCVFLLCCGVCACVMI